MAEKILNLRLKYKNKFLDTAKYERDFKRKFLIGSNKHIFWQILDQAFPKKHVFITKKKDYFTMHLLHNMDISVVKDGKKLSKEDLYKNRILKKKQLKIDRTTVGEVYFSKNWSIEYSFELPYSHKFTKEQIATFYKYHRMAPKTSEQKFTRTFLTIALLVTFIGLYIFEVTYEPPSQINFRDRLKNIEEQATLIQPDFTEDIQEDAEEAVTGIQRASSESEASEATAAAQDVSSADFEREFGSFAGFGEGSGTEDLTGALYETNVLTTKFVESDEGSYSGAGNLGSELVSMGTGTSILDRSGDLGDISDIESLGDLNLGTGSAGFEAVDVAGLGGDLKDYKTVKMTNKKKFDAIRRQYAGISMIKEQDIKLLATPEAKSELANIDQQIGVYKPQINQLYRIESMMIDMSGTIEFSIIIDNSGNIVAVDYNVAKGSFFTTDFLEKAKKAIMNWKIKVKKAVGYSFRVTYFKS